LVLSGDDVKEDINTMKIADKITPAHAELRLILEFAINTIDYKEKNI
tara:strand:+ start:2022 stop:2162 length:141 start_codon:yes stop_codon:yes gene_type:complete